MEELEIADLDREADFTEERRLADADAGEEEDRDHEDDHEEEDGEEQEEKEEQEGCEEARKGAFLAARSGGGRVSAVQINKCDGSSGLGGHRDVGIFIS